VGTVWLKIVSSG